MVEVKVLHVEDAKSIEELGRLADDHDGVILVGQEYTREWINIVEGIRRAGSRWHKIVYVDRGNDTRLSGLGLEDIIEAYRAYFEAQSAYIPVVVSDAGKVVSRRDILKAGLGVFFVYTALPEVRSDRCASLKNCSLCIYSCPYFALHGKPPAVSEKKCMECGLCTSSCPTGLLLTPAFAPDALRRLFYEVRRKGVETIIVTCSRARGRLYHSLDDLNGFVVELPCIASLRLQEYLFARQLGLKVLAYCPREVRESCPRRRAGEEYIKLIGEVESILRPDFEAQPMNSENITELLPPMVKPDDKWSNVERLPTYRVDVDPDKCTLCGACVHECPPGALRLDSQDEYRLLFNHSRCIGCGACVDVCPEDAVSISRSVNPFLLSSRGETQEASSPVARCKKCGEDIGPEKMVRRLEERLRKMGAPASTLEALWLCSDCKRSRLEDEFKRFLESSQA